MRTSRSSARTGGASGRAAETEAGRPSSSGPASAAPESWPVADQPGSTWARLGPAFITSIQRAAGNRAASHVVSRASSDEGGSGRPTVQRNVVASDQRWLQGLLGARGGELGRQIAGDPAARLLGMDAGDRMDTVATVRGSIDAFEVAVGASPGFGDPNAARVVSALEDSQTMDALGTRLVTLFQASVDPLIGLACIVAIDRERVRAALQSNVALATAALTRLATRLAGAAVPANLASPWTFLTTLTAELGAPTTAGVTASTGTRETNVEHILTPPAVASARAAAAAAGRPPPAFVEAGYYSDMIEALHRVATDQYRSADEVNRRTPMDISPGGRVEAIAAEAKRRVDALFGVFGSSVASRMRVGVNLFDQSARPGDPRDMARWFVADSGDARIQHVDENHNAFGVARANAIREDVIDHYSNTPAASGHAPMAGLDARLGTDGPERRRRLTLTDRMWPGMQQAGRVYLTPREGANAAETRRLYWNLFKTCIHEYLHTTANGVYTAWYERLTDPHHKITFQEGFTDWFTLKTWHSVFPDEVASNTTLRQTVQGSPDTDVAAARGDPPHYPEMAEAEQLEAEIGLPNMRAAYFRGNTAVLGGGRLPHASGP